MTNSLLKLTIFTVCIILALVSGCTETSSEDLQSLPDKSNNGIQKVNTTVKVTNIVDGDTIDVTFTNGSTERVRLLGVDTPETHVENEPEEFEGIDSSDYLLEWGHKATDYTQKHLHSEEVRLEYDDLSGKRGYYGRLLAYVYLQNETMYNEMLLKNGYARVYDEAEIEYMDRFLEIEGEAIESNKGLWNN
ncbi:thermonuclease family protein [Methanohalobium sp.]|uniref:thermonuclease family protein n=1 Tax=Methanohalobium sp. TaxID=2837493 RepID=UPI0025D85A96|nr:thermonuclease family protein [Methanohalobium sp.]